MLTHEARAQKLRSGRLAVQLEQNLEGVPERDLANLLLAHILGEIATLPGGTPEVLSGLPCGLEGDEGASLLNPGSGADRRS